MKKSQKLVLGYYLATPLFVLLDGAFGANVRIAALDGEPGWKYAYYALCLVCAGAVWSGVRRSTLLALAECSVNILLLCLGVLLPQYRLAEAILEGGTVENPLALGHVVNFAIAAGIWTLVFHAHLADLSPQRSRLRPHL